MSRIPDIFALKRRCWMGMLGQNMDPCRGVSEVIRPSNPPLLRYGFATSALAWQTISRLGSLLPLLLLAACGPSKSELDAEVRRLCAIDGGYSISEKIELPSDEYDRLKANQIHPKLYSKTTDKYYFESDDYYYLKGNPELYRTTYRFIRKSDEKEFARLVTYARVGGDFYGPWQDSSFACPDPIGLPKLIDIAFVRRK